MKTHALPGPATLVLVLVLALSAASASAQTVPHPNPRVAPRATIRATIRPATRPAPRPPFAGRPRTILFVGNSFTQGAHSAVRNYRAETVHDLNGEGFGGVPALFKQFAEQAGLAWDVSLETQGGRPLAFHYLERRGRLDRAWDVVILQDLSVLDRERPGEADGHVRYAGLLAAMFRHANPSVEVEIDATWTRADETYRPAGHWYGRPITAMALDLRAAADRAARASRDIHGVIPVGEAWNRAFAVRLADPNPYDGINPGQLDLWSYDQYHASTAGYYLEALVIFGHVTGVDPRVLGETERAADALGLSPAQARALQQIAWEQLRAR